MGIMVPAVSLGYPDSGAATSEGGRQEARPRTIGIQKKGAKGFPFCDFQKGCAIIRDLFPEKVVQAQQVLSSTPHLAEGLIRLGFPYSSATIDMALAIQEARHCPFGCCRCLAMEVDVSDLATPMR